MITLAIFAIAVVAGVPAFTEARTRSELRAATSELASAMRWARSEALRTNQRATVSAGTGAVCANGDSAAWSVTVGAQVVRCSPAKDFTARYPNVADLSAMAVSFNGRGVVGVSVAPYTVNAKVTGYTKTLSVEESGRVFESASS
jgi:type IV fimbrial biogenesis protein FimT